MLGERLALAQGDLQAGVFQALAPRRLGAAVADDAQAQVWALAHQQVFRRFAVGQLALVIEGQGGAVLGLFEHAPLARIEMHPHMAAEYQHGAGANALQALLDDLRARLYQRAEIDPGQLLALQGQQGGDHVLAVETHRAAAMAVDAPALGEGTQADALLIGLCARAAAAGQQGLALEAEQGAAALLGIAQPAAEVPGAKGRAPVGLAQMQNIQGHHGNSAGEGASLDMAVPGGCKADDSGTAGGGLAGR
ncbi:hypothetical protein D3C84_366950 [compost metagenome]